MAENEEKQSIICIDGVAELTWTVTMKDSVLIENMIDLLVGKKNRIINQEPEQPGGE